MTQRYNLDPKPERITSKASYRYFLEADRMALGRKTQGLTAKIKEFLVPDEIWRFQKYLRKAEFLKNTKNSLAGNLRLLIAYRKYKKQSLKLGFSIPLNVFGPGLSIAHYGTIVVNHHAKIGANCRIHVCVNIGATSGQQIAPKLGDNVYIGPGAKLFGDINIPSNTIIGANAVVNKSFEEEFTVIAGCPAKVVKRISEDEVSKHIPINS